MSKTITSSVIGPLTQDNRFPDWWIGEPYPIPFFDNKELPIVFMDFEPEEDSTYLTEADDALRAFFGLGAAYRESISHYVYRDCREFIEDVGEEEVDPALLEIKDEREIWQFVQLDKIYLTRRRYRERSIYVQVAGGCDWEIEHGLQLVFKQGRKLTRVSGQDGHVTDADAYGKRDEDDELLSQF